MSISSIKIESTKSLAEIEKKKSEAVLLALPIHKKEFRLPFSQKTRRAEATNFLGKLVRKSCESIDKNGIIFIYGSPAQLIEATNALPEDVKFRYWIAIDAADAIEKKPTKLKHSHIGVLMAIKGKYPKLNTKKNRIPYLACSLCGKNLKDWGGKKHLMNHHGTCISDVWRDLFATKHIKKDPQNSAINLRVVDPQKNLIIIEKNEMPKPVRDRIVSLIGDEKETLNISVSPLALPPIVKRASTKKTETKEKKVFRVSRNENKIVLGDCIEEMEKLAKNNPDGLFDLVFADPPYNLEKDYSVYDDKQTDAEYEKWCNRWLELSVKLTKPTGSIFILNIPKWAISHAKHLSTISYLQNWIVWDALSTPKGKIMPAHYSLLHFSKHPKDFVFNKPPLVDHTSYCYRQQCVSAREGLFPQHHPQEISDIWSDLHRIKHKKHRDDHPCQLPDKLMDRIIQSYSNEGDLVFDPFAGAGTTAIQAFKNKRKYFAMEIDPKYKEIAESKLADLQRGKAISRQIFLPKKRSPYTKKDLEVKAQELAVKLGRKPVLDEFLSAYSINMSAIAELYENPNQLLKKGRIGLLNEAV